MLHHIRKTILNKLATCESQRFGELKPQDLDGNVFNYHLKALISDSYISKTGDGDYSLTPKGRDYIVHRYEDLTSSAHTVFFIVVKNGESYLLRRRKVQPLIGHSGFIHGEPTPDLSVAEAARQRLAAKTGINDIQLDIKGSVLLTQYKNSQLQSYTHAIILYGETAQTVITSSDDTGENYWGDLKNTVDTLPSCMDIINMIESGESWLEKTYLLQ